MSGVGVIISRDEASPLLSRLKDAADLAGLAPVMARAIGIQLKDHLVALDAQRHKYGRHYYVQAARSVTARAAGGFALVSVTQIGIRQRFYGGTITPKSAKMLTIPACPEAYGMRAKEFSDLQVARVLDPQTGHLRLALVRRASQVISISRRKRPDGTIKTSVRPGDVRAGGEVMFWLVRKVTQKADPTVLPTREEMLSAALDAGSRRISRLQERADS